MCTKHVPDIQSDRSFGADGRLVRGADDGSLNELDENAVEAALRLAETLPGEGHEVVALTVGPPEAVDAVRKALQLGAHAAVHVSDEAIAGSDVTATAEVLAAAVRLLDAEAAVDLVFTGMAALDGLTSLLPTLVADRLGLPALTLAAQLEVDAEARTATVRRDLERAVEVLRAPLPAVVSVTDQANEPRYPNVKGILAARKRPVRTLTLADLGLDPARVGAAGARTTVVSAQPRPARTDRVLITDSGDAGVALVDYLVEHALV